jgi:hypothetical protein
MGKKENGAQKMRYNARKRRVDPETQNPAKGIERNPERSPERFLSPQETGRLGDALRLAETKSIEWEVDEAAPHAKHIAKKSRRAIIDPHAGVASRLLILRAAHLREILDARWD